MTQTPSEDEFDLCSLDELREKVAIAFDFEHPRFGRHEVALFWDGERVGALDNYCPHEGAMLSHGVVEPGQVVCPLHAAVFDVATGECLDRYTDDAQSYEAFVRDGRVWARAPGERRIHGV